MYDTKEERKMKFVEPVKEIKQIDKIKKLLGKKRDILLFTMGINSALRISDLLGLKIGDILEGNKIRDSITLKEGKTDKTKSFPLNDSVKKALKEYLAERKDAQPEDVLFLSRKGEGALQRCQAWKILNDAGKILNLNLGSHSLRKTFGYQVYKQTRNLGLTQKLLNHSNSGDTIRYIGIDKEEMDDIYINLNL